MKLLYSIHSNNKIFSANIELNPNDLAKSFHKASKLWMVSDNEDFYAEFKSEDEAENIIEQIKLLDDYNISKYQAPMISLINLTLTNAPLPRSSLSRTPSPESFVYKKINDEPARLPTAKELAEEEADKINKVRYNKEV